MIGTSYGSIIGGCRWRCGDMHVVGLCILLTNRRVIRLFIPATNYMFRINQAVSWNETELYWHPEPGKCVRFLLV
jgi:hypothetical protein